MFPHAGRDLLLVLKQARGLFCVVWHGAADAVLTTEVRLAIAYGREAVAYFIPSLYNDGPAQE